MQKTTIICLISMFMLCSFFNSQAQVSVSYFGNIEYSKVGVGYNFNEKLWTEVRIYSGTSIENLTAEAVLNYNFLQKEHYNTYVGGGFVVNNLNGIVLPVGVQFSPFERLANFSFHIELQPMYEFDFNNLLLDGFWGIRYKFN